MGQPIRPFSDPGVDPVKSDGLSGYANGTLLRSLDVGILQDFIDGQLADGRDSLRASLSVFAQENGIAI